MISSRKGFPSRSATAFFSPRKAIKASGQAARRSRKSDVVRTISPMNFIRVSRMRR